jgi:Na+/pantothenate symporter
MNTSDDPRPNSRRAAVASGLIAGIVTSGVVSAYTPDGNLVVTIVPGVVVGFAAFGVVTWASRARSM